MTSRLTAITPEHLRLWRKWDACYDDSDIAAAYAGRESLSPMEVIDLHIPARDRLLAVLRPEVMGERHLRLAACDFAERAIPLYEARHPGDIRPRQAIEASRRFARGEATVEELRDAGLAAWHAAMNAAWNASAAAWAAAWAANAAAMGVAISAAMSAARLAASRAVTSAAMYAGYVARVDWTDATEGAWAAAVADARAAEREAQVAIVRGYLRAGVSR